MAKLLSGAATGSSLAAPGSLRPSREDHVISLVYGDEATDARHGLSMMW